MAELMMLTTELHPIPGFPRHIETPVYQIFDKMYLAVDRSNRCPEKSKVMYEEAVLDALQKIDTEELKEELIEVSESGLLPAVTIESGKLAPLTVYIDIFNRVIAFLHYPSEKIKQ
jgi:hypothetical protein